MRPCEVKPAFVPPHDFQALHRHADSRIVVFLGGEIIEECFGFEGRFQRGDFVFRPAWFAHADRACEAGASYLRLQLPPRAVLKWMATHGWCAARGQLNPDRLPHGDEVLQLACARPYEVGVRQSPFGCVANELAGDSQPKVSDIATRLGIELHQLSRQFTRAFGMSPVAYRRQARLQRALRMVFEQRQSFARIAVDCGFHDQSQLTHEIKRETGLTPGELARTARF